MRKSHILYPDLSYDIMNVAFEVHNHLGAGIEERFYQAAFELELQRRKIPYERQFEYEVHYKVEYLGRSVLDLVIADRVVIELKSTPAFTPHDDAQLIAYLNHAQLKLGILINFGTASVQSKRIINTNLVDRAETGDK